MYIPLKIELLEVVGVDHSLRAMRLPYSQEDRKPFQGNMNRAGKLIRKGDDHAKCIRGVWAYLRFEMQAGWMIQLDTYRVGVQTLSTSSTMHGALRGLRGAELAEAKQAGLADHVYTRIAMFSYQALRNMYLARRGHRHPDWLIFCAMIRELPYFQELIIPELYGRTKGRIE